MYNLHTVQDHVSICIYIPLMCKITSVHTVRTYLYSYTHLEILLNVTVTDGIHHTMFETHIRTCTVM